MSYRETIEKYKNHLLSEEEEEQVKAEIEKMDAISEYLAECLEEDMNFKEEKELCSNAGMPELLESDETNRETRKSGRQPIASSSEEFEKYVRRSIRRSFAKMAAVVGAVILAVVLFIQFALPPFLSSIYYNPAKRIEVVSEDGNSSRLYDQMSMDLDIYTDLTKPCRNTNTVQVFPLGYGNYSIIISPIIALGTGRFNSTAGQIRKGKLELYNPDYFRIESLNVYACYGLERGRDYEKQIKEASKDYQTQGISMSQWYYVSLEENKKVLEDLDEDKKYIAYVSFKEDLSFKEVNALMEKLKKDEFGYLALPWLAVHVEEENQFGFGHMGYPYETITDTSVPESYNEKYPALTLSETLKNEPDWKKIEEKSQDEAYMTQHFISMLNYMNDQKDFVEMMDSKEPSRGRFRSAARYVKENGLSYYGFVCVTTKKDILNMMKEEKILGIVPRDWE